MALPRSKDTKDIGIDEILKYAVKNNASDIHLSCGSPPRVRIDGDLLVVPGYSVINEEWLLAQIMYCAPEIVRSNFKSDLEADFSHAIDGYGRFRVNASVQRGTPASVFRIIPTEIKTMQQLGVPAILHDLVKKPKGLILVTGETGSGKSTTLAAMIDAINETRPQHIVTIEDPIEFVHTNKMALINQREVGSDTKSFGEALKRVLRQDPDVILLGELRDQETISTALTAAETGHLVFATLHTQSAAKTIDRIIDTFSPIQQDQVRSQLSDTLQAVISQTLIKRKGGGRVAATEILIKNSAISNNIREGNISGITNAMFSGKAEGMHTLDQDLQRLVKSDLIDREEVRDLLTDKSALDGIAIISEDWSH